MHAAELSRAEAGAGEAWSQVNLKIWERVRMVHIVEDVQCHYWILETENRCRGYIREGSIASEVNTESSIDPSWPPSE